MISSVLAFLTAMLATISKLTPSDKVREEAQERRRQRVSSLEFTKIYDRQFHRLKAHTEIDIKTDVSFINYNLPDDQEAMLVELLTARVKKYRQRHPIIFRKWLKENN